MAVGFMESVETVADREATEAVSVVTVVFVCDSALLVLAWAVCSAAMAAVVVALMAARLLARLGDESGVE